MQTLLLVAAVVMLAILLVIHVAMYSIARTDRERREAESEGTFIHAASYDPFPTGRDIGEAIVRTLGNSWDVHQFHRELEDLRDIQKGINNAFNNDLNEEDEDE